MARTRKKPQPKDTTTKDAASDAKKNVKQDAKTDKKAKASLRERNKKAAESKDKPRRIRKAASSAKRPVSGAAKALTTEFHLNERPEEPGFFSKSRRITPAYFVKSMAELRHVTWPGRKETWKLVFAVFVFALIMGGFIAILDFGLEQLFRNVIL